jgi:hypothetical protein
MASLAQARAGTAPKRKLFDGGSLYLTLTPAGTAVWRLSIESAVEKASSPPTFTQKSVSPMLVRNAMRSALNAMALIQRSLA